MSAMQDDSRLSEKQIELLLSAGTAAARERKVTVTLAAVDGGGHLLGLVRMNGAHTATTDVALAKARCAAAFRRQTRLFAEQLAAGNLSMLAVPGCIPLQGGIPIIIGQRLIGAVGVSGAAPDIDDAIATIAEQACHDIESSIGLPPLPMLSQ
jgi:glc operon protein GlcG